MKWRTDAAKARRTTKDASPCFQSPCFQPPLGLLAILLLAVLVAPTYAADAEFCVANDADFGLAAVTALFVPTTIKFVKGTYHIDGTVFDGEGKVQSTLPVFQGFSLLGGYTANCASRQIDPANTTLTITPGVHALFNAQVIGNVTIEGIRFHGEAAGPWLLWYEYYYPTADSVSLVMRRNIVDGEALTIIYYDVYTGSHSFSAQIVENLIVGPSFTGADACVYEGLGALNIASIGSVPAYTLVNNTIVGGKVDGLCASGSGAIYAYNNIFYNNAYNNDARDVYINMDGISTLVDNVVGTHNYNGGAIESGTLTGDPQLDSNYRPIESPQSPVIDSGKNNAPGGLPAHDLDGGPRIVGTTVDRGVYESSINAAFLQSVGNKNDSGDGSLRAAIANANAHDSALITFDIGSGCPQVITLDSELPALTHGGIINGFTQMGASANDLDTGDDATLCVILESGNSSVTHGLQVAADAGDAAAASIRGIGFSGFSDAAIDLQGGSGHFVAGNRFAGSIGGHALQPNGIDIRLGVSAHDATVGSDDVADRNIIGDATGSGIVMQGGIYGALVLGTYNNQILNNYIGVGWSVNAGNYTNRGNGTRGIHLLGHDNTISGNVIGNNVQAGILIDGGGAQNNVIGSNFIGVGANGATIGNGNAGIHLTNASAGAPSGNTIRYNTIAYNDDEGVLVSIGQGNKIRKNSIFDNGLLGIDLAGGGITPNDDDGGFQQKDYANRGQNFPLITGAAGGYHNGRISGTLTTTGGDYTVDIYLSPGCDASGNGEGKTWLQSTTVTVTVPQGLDEGFETFDIAFTTLPALPLFNGNAITATATGPAGDTSEFSTCASYLNDTIFADGF